MTEFKEHMIYKCIASGPLMVRKNPDDKAQAISVIRPNAEVECLGMNDGIIYKIPVENSKRVDNVWMKTSKGYVRVVSLNGTRENFELAKLKKQMTICTPENTEEGDTVMVSPGAVNTFGVKPDDSFYAPTQHKVLSIDSTGEFLYIGTAMDNGSWYNMKDCALVFKNTKKHKSMGK